MKRSQELRNKRKRTLINLIGFVLLAAACVLVGLLFFVQSPELQRWYAEYQHRLMEMEDGILALRNVWQILVTVLLLYGAKSIFPFFPISLMCVVTAAVLPVYLSIAVNIAGIMLLVSLKYLWGRRRGGGSLQRLLSLNTEIQTFFERDGSGNPWLLFVFRLVPSFPVNPVSQIYGAMGFDYTDYVLISLLGFLPRLLTYIFIGSNAFDPLSVPFLIPLIIIFALSGISAIGISFVLNTTSKRVKGLPK